MPLIPHLMDTVLVTKVVSALFYPLGLTVALLLIALVARGLRKRGLARACLLTGSALLLIASNPIVAQRLVGSLEAQFPQQPLASISAHDAIVVLGGGLRLPQEPARYSQLVSGSDRYWHAARLFHAGKAKTIILAGGNVFNQSGLRGEAFYAAQILQKWGVPAKAIVFETDSRTTQQNLDNIRSLITAQRVHSVLLVTSAYHMPRALSLFSELPVRVTPASADVLIRQVQQPVLLQWLPSASALSLTTLAMHEYYGMMFNSLKRLVT